jgi:hypothetical protein
VTASCTIGGGLTTEPITELPFLESSLWERIVLATAGGEIGEARELAEALGELGYQVVWEPGSLRLTHVDTGQQMTQRV